MTLFQDGFTPLHFIIKMIQQISQYEYLGNSLQKFNSNMNELNVRIDHLYSDSNKWNSMTNTLSALLSSLNSFSTLVASNSSNWKRSSDLVYNLRGYWEEPIMVVYKNTFNCVANMTEIETWLNDNFPSSNFSPTQIMRCDFLCKNYSAEGLAGVRIREYKPEVQELLAANYSVTVGEIYDFLSYKNILESLIVVFNSLFRKYGKESLNISGIDAMTEIVNYVYYNVNTDSFESAELIKLSQTDLKMFHSYVYQYETAIVKYNLFVQRNFLNIPNNVLVQFEPRNISNYTGGRFFFKIRNKRWSYHDYKNIEFCAANLCNDCFEALPINELYIGEKDCPQRFKYLLTECEFEPSYVSPSAGPLMLNVPDNEDYNILDHLFS